MNVLTRGVRNAFRNPVRSAAIIIIVGLSLGLSLSMLLAYQAVGQRITTLKANVGNTITVSAAGIRGFDGGGNPLTMSQLASVKSLAHVTAVDESLNDRLTTSDTNLQSAVDLGQLGRRFAMRQFSGGFGGSFTFATFTPPITVIGTTSPTTLNNTQAGGTVTLVSGQMINGASSDHTALVGNTLASKNNLAVGSTFTAYGQTITVSGIFNAGNTFSNNLLVMPLATVQQLSGQSSDVTSATVTVDSISNLDSVAKAISNQLGDAADVTTATDRTSQIIAPLENVQNIALYSLIGATVAAAAITLLIMVMTVRERRREIGILKALGATNASVVAQFTSEALAFTILGAAIGILGGIVGGKPIATMLVTSNASAVPAGGRLGGGFLARSFGGVSQTIQSISTTVGWSLILYGLAAALLIAILGSALAAWSIAKVRPAEVMRTE